jgi:outer membrane protein OmpA-like peptidoglycan-associated protein
MKGEIAMRHDVIMSPKPLARRLAALLLVGCATGCASQAMVREEVGEVDRALSSRLDALAAELAATHEATGRLADIVDRHETQLAATAEAAGRALDQAMSAAELARGRFVAEVALSEDGVTFASGSAALDERAVAVLDLFAAQVLVRNDDVHLELQGHTDATGSERANRELGLRRAEMVLRYLHDRHGFPLHRMNVIAYGPHQPVADNATPEGRARNRRVSVVVLS